VKVLWLYLLAFMVFPVLGELIIWYRGLTITSGAVEPALIISNLLFVLIVITIAYRIQRCNVNKELLPPKFDSPFALRTVNRSIMLVVLVFVITYMAAGYMIVHGTAGRGEIRVSLGYFGIIYTWMTLYLVPGVLIANSIIYTQCDHKVQRQLRTKLFFLYSLVVLIGILTGTKAGFLIMIMGGIAVLSHKRLTLRRLLLLVLILAIGLVGTTAFTRNLDMASAINFLIHRMTIMSAYGTVGVWNAFPDGVSFDDFMLYALSVFGNRLASVLSGYSVHSVNFLPINPSRLITYMVYPDPVGALAGTVNVTITNFGEAVYVFGRRLFFIHAMIAGLILGVSIRLFRRSLMEGRVMKGTLCGVYFFSVVIPWVNGGGIWSLIGLPTIIWLLSTYIILFLIVKTKPLSISTKNPNKYGYGYQRSRLE